MTILPKKKTSQAKNDPTEGERENVGNVSSHHSQIPSSNENRDRLYTQGRNSPPRWPPNNRDDIRPPSGTAGSNYEEYEELEVVNSNVGGGNVDRGTASSVPNAQHKRRHRASPHRNGSRKHRDIRTTATCATTSAGIIPPVPSTSANVSTALATLNNSSTNSTATCVGTAPVAKVNDDSLNEDYSGYNSGDEYCQNSLISARSEEEWNEVERIFEKKLRKKGLIIKIMCQDGACLFRAVADQVYGDQEMHPVVRKHCMDYMGKNADYFSQYVTEDFDQYVKRKRLNHIHGNHVEMQAMCELFNRSIEVFHYTTDAINTFHSMHSTDNEPIRISYHKKAHYNSIVDPYKATVGVGLGLPGMMPGLAEKNLMKDAVKVSEEFHLEQAMLEDKLKATDWEATSEAIEEQVARESYLQWLRDNERRNRKASTRSATATCSSSTMSSGGASPDIRSPVGGRSPRGRLSPSAGSSPAREGSSFDVNGAQCSTSGVQKASSASVDGVQHGPEAASSSAHPDFSLSETASFINQLPPDVFGFSEWEDAGILAQVLAASQQEYLDCLKRMAVNQSDDDTRLGEASTSRSAGEPEAMVIEQSNEKVANS